MIYFGMDTYVDIPALVSETDYVRIYFFVVILHKTENLSYIYPHYLSSHTELSFRFWLRVDYKAGILIVFAKSGLAFPTDAF